MWAMMQVTAITGTTGLTRDHAGNPVWCGFALGDVISGMAAHSAILLALRNQERHGLGRVLDLSLVDAALPLVKVPAAWDDSRIGGEQNAGAGVKIAPDGWRGSPALPVEPVMGRQVGHQHEGQDPPQAGGEQLADLCLDRGAHAASIMPEMRGINFSGAPRTSTRLMRLRAPDVTLNVEAGSRQDARGGRQVGCRDRRTEQRDDEPLARLRRHDFFPS